MKCVCVCECINPPHLFRGTPAVSRSLSGWRWCTRLSSLISVLLWKLSAGWVRSSSTLVRLVFPIISMSRGGQHVAWMLPSLCLYVVFQTVWGGSCVRWACREVLRGRTPHSWTSWCSTTPRCGKVTLIHGDQEQQKTCKRTDLSVCLSRYLSVSPGLCPSACRSEEHLPPAVDEQPPHGPQIQEDLCCTVCQGNTPDQHTWVSHNAPRPAAVCCRLLMFSTLINKCSKYSQVN